MYPLSATYAVCSLLNSIYPAIDPQPAWTSQSFAGKTVLIVGASRGIGQTIALYYAKAGASVALTARSSLEDTRALIATEAPGAKVLTFEADVKDKDRAAEVVTEIVNTCGGLDVLIYNSAASLAWEKRKTILHVTQCVYCANVRMKGWVM